MLVILGCLVGAVLGMRYKVLSLLPITGLGLLIMAAIAIVQNGALWSALLPMVLLSVSLQLGYLCGTGIRFVMIAARMQRVRPALTADSTVRPNT